MRDALSALGNLEIDYLKAKSEASSFQRSLLTLGTDEISVGSNLQLLDADAICQTHLERPIPF